jgi:hypothetical protein
MPGKAFKLDGLKFQAYIGSLNFIYLLPALIAYG